MLKKEFETNSALAEYHFKFIFILNFIIYTFFLFYKGFMAIHITIGEKLNFFTGYLKFYEKNCPHLTLFRVFTPTILLILFIWLCFRFFHTESRKETRLFLRNILHIESKDLKRYFLFILIAFLVLSFIPGFLLLIRNINTQYGFLDADSYVSLITLMYNGDYNTNTVPEGGLQFAKYYIITLPTLLLTFILGIGNIVASYNIVITLLFFTIILNIAFTFRNLFFSKDDCLRDEINDLLFIGALLLLSLRLVIFKDYFNYDTILVTYSTGFYGAIGGIFVFSSILFIFSHLFRKSEVDFKKTISVLLITILFSFMLIQSYFNLTLFLLPTVGVILSVFLSRKTTLVNTMKLSILFFLYLIINISSFIVLDVLPQYNMDPITKLYIVSFSLIIFFIICIILNRKMNNLVLKLFLRLRHLNILVLFSLPFVCYIFYSKNINRIELLDHPIKLGESRLYFFSLFLCVLLIGYCFFGFLRIVLSRKRFSILFSLNIIFFLFSIIVSHYYDVKKYLIFKYPTFYPRERRIMDRKNLYAFDKNVIKVNYNKYLVDVAKYFVKIHIGSMYYWIVSKTPSNGVYEHGLIQRILANRYYEVEGITLRHFENGELDNIQEWAQIRLSNKTIKTYEEFLQNIFDIEKETRETIRRRFKHRFIILDINVPQGILDSLNNSPLFKKVYENKLYKIYRLS